MAPPTYRAAADRGVVSVWGAKLMLTEFGNSIWLADGQDPVTVAGFHYPTRMAVIRLADGKLFVWSPVKLSEALAKSIEDLGPIGYLIAPNHLHHLYLADWINASFLDAPVIRKSRARIRKHFALVRFPFYRGAVLPLSVLVLGLFLFGNTSYRDTIAASASVHRRQRCVEDVCGVLRRLIVDEVEVLTRALDSRSDRLSS